MQVANCRGTKEVRGEGCILRPKASRNEVIHECVAVYGADSKASQHRHCQLAFCSCIFGRLFLVPAGVKLSNLFVQSRHFVNHFSPLDAPAVAPIRKTSVSAAAAATARKDTKSSLTQSSPHHRSRPSLNLTMTANTIVTISAPMELNPVPSRSGGRRRRRNRRTSNDSQSSSSSDSSTFNVRKGEKNNHQPDGNEGTTCKNKSTQGRGGRGRRRRNRTRSHNQSNKSSKKNASDNAIDNIPNISEDMFVALDCEMVGVGEYGQRSMVARVTLIDWYGHILMDEYIQPTETVTDYRTFVSGITEADLYGSSNGEEQPEEELVVETETDHPTPAASSTSNTKNLMTLEECRVTVQSLIQDKILIGHALKNDLKALDLTHPWQQTRDTGKYEPFMKEVLVAHHDFHHLPHSDHEASSCSASACSSSTASSSDEYSSASSTASLVLCPRKLCQLTKYWLHRDIQIPGQAHCPYEDALAALDLYKLVQTKWERSMSYKIQKTKKILEAQEQQLRREIDFPPLIIATPQA